MTHDGAALEVDHVVIAVRELARAAGAFADRYGLASTEGGRHVEWGTANRIIPVGDAYVELVSVVDADRARSSDFGHWVANAQQRGRVQLLGWAVRTTSIDDVAERLHLVVNSGSRAARDGRLLQWRLAGVTHAAADPSLPFFIEWDPDTPHPSRAPVTHRSGPVEVGRLELHGDAKRIAAWLGEHQLPVVIRPGTPAVARIILTCSSGELILDAADR